MSALRKLELRLQQSAWVQRMLQRIYAAYMNLVLRSTRWSYVGFERAEADIAKSIPRIYCCWHSRLALSPFFRRWGDHRMSTFSSVHVDAQIVTNYYKSKGIGMIPVKTTGEMTGPIRQAVKELRSGGSLGFTPDGPFGPPEVVQPGAILVGAMAQVPVSAIAFSTRWRLTLKTWDKAVLPLPFGRGVFVMVEGTVPPRHLDKEQMQAAQLQLGALISEATQTADRLVDTRK